MTQSLVTSAPVLTQKSLVKPVQVISNVEVHQHKDSVTKPASQYHLDIVWRNVILLSIFHILASYGMWLKITQAMWKTTLFFYAYGITSALGVTGGAHRLWAHKTYKARLPLRILLMIFHSACFQNHIYEWARDHRVHHKFTDTDADPHNSRRGFFFSHMGWLMVRKHKDVLRKGKTVDMSDLESDPVVQFQRKYYLLLALVFCFVIPDTIPCYFWNEKFFICFCMGFTKYVMLLHVTWSVNSAAHIFGMRPYDSNINPTENRFVAFIAIGEGWHNYHHIFPWDYKAGELGGYTFNVTKAFLDFMAKIGWAYDLKTASPDMVKRRALRTGDGTWQENGSDVTEDGEGQEDYHHKEALWGWGDRDMKEDEMAVIKRINHLSE